MPNVQMCTHIKVNGVRCGSPTLRGEQFCYFHQRLFRSVKSPHSRLHQIALLEDNESIQASVMEVVNGLVRGTLDLKRAELVLRALNTAVRNSRAVHFNIHAREMVRQVPDYPEPRSAVANSPESSPESALEPGSPNLPPVAATKLTFREPTLPDIATAPITRVATAAPVSSRGPQTPSRNAPNWKPNPTRPKPPVSLREEAAARKPQKSVAT